MMNNNDIRDTMIADVVKDKTFVDIGALWFLNFEKISVAHKFGAKKLTLIDQCPSDHVLWLQMKHKLNNIDYKEISSNLLDHHGTYDVVYCSGVLYHAPDPLNLLKHLYKMTNECLIISSICVDGPIATKYGTLELPQSGMMFLPAVSDFELQILGESIGKYCNCIRGINVKADPSSYYWNYWDWWWIYTKQVMEAMLVSVGFKIQKVEKVGDFLYSFVCTP